MTKSIFGRSSSKQRTYPPTPSRVTRIPHNGVLFILSLFSLLCLLACTSTIPTPIPTETPVPPEPTATPDITADFIGLMSSQHGIALRHPADWVVEDGPTLVLASDQAVLADTSGQTTGTLLILNEAPTALATSDDLAASLADLVAQDGVRIFAESGNFSLNGQEAAQLTAVSVEANGIEFNTDYMVIRNGERTVIFTGATPDYETFEPILRAILETVIIEEIVATPTPLPPTLTPVPTPTAVSDAEGEETDPEDVNRDETTDVETEAAIDTEDATGDTDETAVSDESQITLTADIPSDFVQYVSSEDWYTLGYPSEWLIDDRNPQAVLFASNEALLVDNPFSEGGGTVFVYSGEVSLPTPPSAVFVLENFISSYAIYDGFDLVISPYELQINGQNGANARYNVTFQRIPVIADYYAIVKGSRFMIFVSLTEIDSIPEIRPQVDAMVASTTIK